MRAWRKIFAAVLIGIALIFIAGNLLVINLNSDENSRPYRVEINRLALQIEEDGLENVDLSELEYVNSIAVSEAKSEKDFYNADSDYAIREINGKLYRFDYTADDNNLGGKITAAVNVILAVMSAAVLGILFYFRSKVLIPFEKLTDVPYELSKGNLTVPVKENKNRFFGRFLWGIDLLRENIEQRKQRELILQKEKKTLLLSLSHDVKTPLSVIKLYSKALYKNLYKDADKQREIAKSIDQKADEIEGYINQIIGASREDFLSLEVKNSEFYLKSLVAETENYYKEKAALVKTDFEVREYKNLLVSGDLDRAVEVLQNLIENALKYGDGKKIELLFSDEDEGALVAVRNSGCTLKKEELPHIFESFWRGVNSLGIQGSGLGLYICRQLMHKMKGEIFAQIEGDFITVAVIFKKA